MTLKDRNRVAGKFLLQLKLGIIFPDCRYCNKYMPIKLLHYSPVCNLDRGNYYLIGMKNGKVAYVFDQTGRIELMKKNKDKKIVDITDFKNGIAAVYWCPDFKKGNW